MLAKTTKSSPPLLVDLDCGLRAGRRGPRNAEDGYT